MRTLFECCEGGDGEEVREMVVMDGVVEEMREEENGVMVMVLVVVVAGCGGSGAWGEWGSGSGRSGGG
ncbi:hypothetical protein Tco_1459507 [Tanacetum coccineum]